MSSLTIEEFENLIAEAYSLEARIAAIKRLEMKPLQEELDKLDARILEELESTGKSSYKSNCGTVMRSRTYSVRVPVTDEAKRQFFGWLESKGPEVYWRYTTVNSQSLNSLYKAEREIAVEEGDVDWTIPGLEAPTLRVTLSKRSK